MFRTSVSASTFILVVSFGCVLPACGDESSQSARAIDQYIDINATGRNASATGPNAIAMGEGAVATAPNSMAIGTRSQARFDNSVALGRGAQAQRNNQLMFGTRSSTYTMPGLTSPGARAHQDGPLELVTIDSNGNLASDGGSTVGALQNSIDTNERAIIGNASRVQAIETRVASQQGEIAENQRAIGTNASRIQTVEARVSSQQQHLLEVDAALAQNTAALMTHSAEIASLQTSVEQLQGDMDALSRGLSAAHADVETNTVGIAIANALSGSGWLQSNETAAVSVNAGYFDGETAIAISGTARLHQNWSANLAIGSVPSRGDVGARGGLRLGW